jgi:5-methylcytosine-specific restriction endonuclease McrA
VPGSVRAVREHVFVSRHAPRGAPDRTRLEELASAGVTLREIALALDRSVATVRYWLRRWSIPRADARRTRVDPATAPREVMRSCPRHGRAVFRLDIRATYRCVLCAQERVAERRRRIKRMLVDEAGGCCAACGYDRSYAALQFHHVNPAEKSFGLASRGFSRGIDRAREEARKCVLLCGNCHAEVEAGLRVLEAPRGGFEPPRTD